MVLIKGLISVLLSVPGGGGGNFIVGELFENNSRCKIFEFLGGLGRYN